MNSDIQQMANAMVVGTLSHRNAIVPSSQSFQEWFLGSDRGRTSPEENLRIEERRRERERIARNLHDTLLQGFLGASFLLSAAVDQVPVDSPAKATLNRAMHMMGRVIDEGRDVLRGLRSPVIASGSLEQALSDVICEFAPSAAEFRIVVTGKSRLLDQEVQEEAYLIGREALSNALRHSGATSIEVEVEYLPRRLRMVVRDNGCGMNAQLIRTGRSSHWGLLGMRERANNLNAKLDIWSRPGLGTEVEVSVPIES